MLVIDIAVAVSECMTVHGQVDEPKVVFARLEIQDSKSQAVSSYVTTVRKHS